MKRYQVPQRGDVFWLDPNPVAGREMKDRHRFIVITPKEINALGLVMMIPVTTSGAFARAKGLTVPILDHNTRGVAVCNQIRTFDLESRVKNGSAFYVETLDDEIIEEIINRVVSVIDPA